YRPGGGAEARRNCRDRRGSRRWEESAGSSNGVGRLFVQEASEHGERGIGREFGALCTVSGWAAGFECGRGGDFCADERGIGAAGSAAAVWPRVLRESWI